MHSISSNPVHLSALLKPCFALWAWLGLPCCGSTSDVLPWFFPDYLGSLSCNERISSQGGVMNNKNVHKKPNSPRWCAVSERRAPLLPSVVPVDRVPLRALQRLIQILMGLITIRAR